MRLMRTGYPYTVPTKTLLLKNNSRNCNLETLYGTFSSHIFLLKVVVLQQAVSVYRYENPDANGTVSRD
jgi:hypothetical protein